MTPVPHPPLAALEADCQSCLDLLDSLHASIFHCERQLLERDSAAPATRPIASDAVQASQLEHLHADFCNGLDQHVALVNQRLAHLVDTLVTASAATPDADGACAFLRQRMQEADAAYQRFCQVRLAQARK